MHSRADPYGSDPKLVRIGLPCTLAPSYRSQFGSTIRSNEVRIKRTELCGSDPFGSRVNHGSDQKKKMQIGNAYGAVRICSRVHRAIGCVRWYDEKDFASCLLVCKPGISLQPRNIKASSLTTFIKK